MSHFHPPAPLNARASVVNRTHRIVREQAMAMREQRSRRRSLWVPIAICSPLLMFVLYAVYATLQSQETVADRSWPDAGGQLFLLLLWVLPVTAFLVGAAWFRKARTRSQDRAL